MAIFTGGKSKAINSPRHLTLRHARRSVAESKHRRGITATHDDPPPILKPGEEKLNSFWAPGLEAGPEHVISVKQTIKSPNSGEKELELVAKQVFYVDAPQFSLPEGSVYSVYPPSGYPDDHRILPHVVLSDPHLPWERRGSPSDDDKQSNRNKVPWLILLTFTQEELRLSPDALDVPFKQTSTLAVKTVVGDVLAMKTVASPIPSILEQIKTEPEREKIKKSQGDFIFVKPDLFKSIFSTFDEHNNRQVPASPDVNKFKYLAHVRNINTTGMAVAGVEDVGIFSMVVGSRSGPLENPTPVSVSVHLVSIEGVEDMKSFPDDKSLVALCSLHSWNYTVMPPGMLNIYDAFTSLGETLDVLRAPDERIQPLRSSSDRVSKRLADRLYDGYSMVKYRLQTGEQTVALYRGPFTPTVVAPNENLDKCSNSGQDLQILDREVGIMDVSYAIAWQVGRNMALGNQSFAAALSRFRTAIQSGAMKECKLQAIRSVGGQQGFRRRTDVLAGLAETVKNLETIHVRDPAGPRPGQPPRFRAGKPQQRWLRQRLSRKTYPALGFNASKIKKIYLENAKKIAKRLALAKDGSMYDETNNPVSTDWMVILAWVMDRMFLAGVPAHYLISDPSHLEHERLRFFNIDPNWVGCMIDGALSLANHMGEDRDREAIKHIINEYITNKPEHQAHTPQIPKYGFYLRSDLVTMFPDLKVTTLPKPPDDAQPERAPLLRHEIVADGVMLGLLDRKPGSDEFSKLVFTQPPHQQRFAVGHGLTKDDVGLNIRRQYTVSQKERELDPDRHLPLEKIAKKPTDDDNWFIWSTVAGSKTNDVRMIRLPFFAEEQRRILQNEMPTLDNGQHKFFDDDTPNSALLAMQLIDPFYDLTIELKGSLSAVKLAGLSPPQASDQKSSALRTLNMEAHSKVLRLVDYDDDLVCHIGKSKSEREEAKSTKLELEQEITTSFNDSTLFRRHDRYRPSADILKTNLAPHVHAIPSYQPISIAAEPPRVSHQCQTRAITDDDSPSSPPTFTCDVYTTGAEAIHTDKDRLPEDMVISIHVGNNKNSDYFLKELDIVIPLGPANEDEHRLMEEYDGPGPRMLSNLRFNVLASLRKKGRVLNLVLRLLPRSVTGYIEIRKIDDLSFLLCLAQVNLFARRTTLVGLTTEAYYRQKYDKVPRQDRFTVTLVNNSIQT